MLMAAASRQELLLAHAAGIAGIELRIKPRRPLRGPARGGDRLPRPRSGEIDRRRLLSICEKMFCATWVGEVPAVSSPSALNSEVSASAALLPAAARRAASATAAVVMMVVECEDDERP